MDTIQTRDLTVAQRKALNAVARQMGRGICHAVSINWAGHASYLGAGTCAYGYVCTIGGVEQYVSNAYRAKAWSRCSYRHAYTHIVLSGTAAAKIAAMA